MIIYVCLNVKYLKIACNVHTKICDLIKNYIHHGNRKLHQEVETGCIIVKHYDAFALPETEIIHTVQNKTL